MFLDIVVDACEIVALAEHPYVRHTPYSVVPIGGNDSGDSSGPEESGVIGTGFPLRKGGR
jgi:hypothetical protein